MAKTKASYKEDRRERLKDPEEAVGYLKACLEETDMPELFLVALRDVADARGMSQLAKDTHLDRVNLYRILSKQGNPELGSLYAILEALGLKLSVELKGFAPRS
ncbi:MAG: addiction module antidote protein [Pyrinomonadaceae bacterium]